MARKARPSEVGLSMAASVHCKPSRRGRLAAPRHAKPEFPETLFPIFPGTAAPDLAVGNGSSVILPLSRLPQCRVAGPVPWSGQNGETLDHPHLWGDFCGCRPLQVVLLKQDQVVVSLRIATAPPLPGSLTSSHTLSPPSMKNADRRNVILPPRHGRQQRRYERRRSSFAEAARSLAKDPALLLPSKSMPCMPPLQCASANSIAASAQPHRLATPALGPSPSTIPRHFVLNISPLCPNPARSVMCLETFALSYVST